MSTVVITIRPKLPFGNIIRVKKEIGSKMIKLCSKLEYELVAYYK